VPIIIEINSPILNINNKLMHKREATKSPASGGSKAPGAKPKTQLPKPVKMGGKLMVPKVSHGPITKPKSVS
jgi:hypothetical protein